MIFRIPLIAHRLVAVVIVASVLAGCATSRQVELEFQVRHLEQALAYAQEDNVALLNALEQYERGLRIQAQMIRQLDENCSI